MLFEAFGLSWIGDSEVSTEAATSAQTVGTPEPIAPEPEEPIQEAPPSTSIGTRPTRPARPIVSAPKPKRLIQTQSELEQLREQIRAWAATGTIENPSRWNRLIYELVERLDARKLGMPSVLVSRVITPEMVKLQGSTSGARDYFTVEAEPWVRNGLEAYLALRRDSSMTLADAAFHRHNLATMMRHLERCAATYLDRRIPPLPEGERWSPVSTFAQILLARAWLRGVVPADAPVVEQIRAILDDEAESESDFHSRSEPWRDWVNATSKVHKRLRDDLRSMIRLPISDGAGGAPLTDSSVLAGAVIRFCETAKFDPVPEAEVALPDPFERALELAELWRDKRFQIERTEASLIVNRTQKLSELLRNRSVTTHLGRLDKCITGIATLLPSACADQVTEWKRTYSRFMPKLDEGAGIRAENLIVAIEAEEMPAKLPLRLGWLARAPARDLEDLLSTVQLGEKVMGELRDHARDCVREAGGTGSLAQVKAIGGAIKAAVANRTMAVPPA